MKGQDFNQKWKFTLGNPPCAHLQEFDDTEWESVTLPHDWSIKMDFDREKGQACTAFLPGGFGWYRKQFVTTEEMTDKIVILNFDGIYNRSIIYCNGRKVTFHPNGYAPCLVNITDYLNPLGSINQIAVSVDHTRYADSRWYTGSGIYRKVSMFILPLVHIPIWGTYYTVTSVSKDRAVINGEIRIKNEDKKPVRIKMKLSIFDPDNQKVKEYEQPILLEKQSSRIIKKRIQLKDPTLWEIGKGNLYTMQIKLYEDNEPLVTWEDQIGIRDFYFDAEEGLYVNEQSIKIKGACLHHDGGALGTAVPLAIWKKRLEVLQKCGCNAIRTAHNPASEEFLDLCDQMGFLVQEEFFDEWDNPKDKRYNCSEREERVDYITRGYTEFFREYGKEDLQNTILRDRNHPCIIQWSIGNEIEWTYPKYNTANGYSKEDFNGTYFWTMPKNTKEEIRTLVSKIPREEYEVDTTAYRLAQWTKELDDTRPVIANCVLPCVSYETGYIDALDMVGYSYRQSLYEYGHHNYPDKPVMGTENFCQWHEWKSAMDKKYVAGIFLWAGIDYIGEGGGDNIWPWKGISNGLLDSTGYEKPSYHMFRSLWTEDACIHLETQRLSQSIYKLSQDGRVEEIEKDAWKYRLWNWHSVNPYWDYQEDELIVVEAYSNCPDVELLLNGQSFGHVLLKECDDHIMKWVVPFVKGTLTARAKLGNEVIVEELVTPGAFHQLVLVAEKEELMLSKDDIVMIEVFLADRDGNKIQNIEKEVTFHIGEHGLNCGVDNGYIGNVTGYAHNVVSTYHGRAVLFLGGATQGECKITASTKGVYSNPVTIQIQAKK